MNLSLRNALASAAMVATVLLPFRVSAAASTPQATLDAALAAFMAQTNIRAESEVDLMSQKRALKEKAYLPDVSARFRMSQRSMKAMDGKTDSEGKLVIERFARGETDQKLSAPLTIEWKKVGTSIYFKVSALPQEILDGLGALEVDPTPILGKWLRIDLGESASLEDALASELSVSDLSTFLKGEKLPTIKQLLRVIRVESTTTGADGHKHLRLRVRLNPQVVTLMQQKEIAAVSKGTGRTAAVREINTRYAKMRLMLAGLQMVAVVDATTNTLERIELGMQRIEPTQDCAWNDAWTKQVCKTIGYQKSKLAVGISFFMTDLSAIVAPADAQSLEDALKSIAPPEPELLDELDATSSMEM